MSDTPARVTRSRSRQHTPLPAIPARQSLAYGSSGRTEIRGQMAKPGTSLAAAFEAARRPTAVPEAVDEGNDQAEDAAEKTPAAVAKAPKAAKKAPALDSGAAGPAIAPGTAPGFAPGFAPGTAPAPASATAPDQRTETVIGDAAYVDPQDVLPSFLQILRAVILEVPGEILHDTFIRFPRFVFFRCPAFICRALTLANISWFFKNFFLFGFIFWMITYMTLPATADWVRLQSWWRFSQVSRAVWDLPVFDVPLFAEQWMQIKYLNVTQAMLPQHNVPERQWVFNTFMLQKLEDLEESVRELQGDVKLHDQTFDHLDTILPVHISMRERMDTTQIPEDFWAALADRMSEADSHPIWDAFLAANTQKIRSMSQDAIKDALDSGQIVNKATFAEMLSENNGWMREQYKEEFDAIARRNLKSVKKIAESETKALMQRSPSLSFAQKQLETLANANELHNLREALRHVNFFSRGNGASIIPHLTSPTAATNNGFMQRSYAWYQGIPKPHGPAQALTHWAEATECWCASPSQDQRGTAQLTVHLGKKVFPERVVVEHIPALGTLNIAAAPRQLEFWADAGTVEIASELQTLIARETPQIDDYECVGEPPAPHFVCIGKGKYDIHGANNVQSFPMFADTQALGFGTKNVAVKAISNWGSDVTCFYRLRLVGDHIP
ncbi:hypothetical protein MBLNU230_g1703t1 [Neophaeotheca triangularis]